MRTLRLLRRSILLAFLLSATASAPVEAQQNTEFQPQHPLQILYPPHDGWNATNASTGSIDAQGVQTQNTPSGFPSGVMDGVVNAVAANGSDVYVGGHFTVAGELDANNIAKLDTMTNTWSALGSGVSGSQYYGPWVKAIAVGDDGTVCVGGDFATAGGVLVNSIAKWDGNVWSPLGSGVAGAVYPDGSIVHATGVSGRDVYVGGAFTLLGGKPSYYFGRWHEPITRVKRGEPRPEYFALHQNRPNPFNALTAIKFSLPRACYATLKLYNTLGEQVATLLVENLSPGEHEIIWNAGGFGSGLYFCCLRAGELVASRKMTLLK